MNIVATAQQLARSPKFGNVELAQLPQNRRQELVDSVATSLKLPAVEVQQALVAHWNAGNERGATAMKSGLVAPGRTDGATHVREGAGGATLAYFNAKVGAMGGNMVDVAKLPGAELLSAGETKALAALHAVRPKQPVPLFLLTDPNKDPDDLSVMIHLKHLSDAGFVDLKGVVTTLGDTATRTKRAEFAASVLDQLGISAKVGVGGDYAFEVKGADGNLDSKATEGRKKDHAKFVDTPLMTPGVKVESDGRAVLREGLKGVADKSAVLLVNAGMADAAALLRDDPQLAKEKIQRLVIMGGVNAGVDANGHVSADSRAYNNTTHQDSASFVYQRAQELGIELVIVAKEAAYSAAAPRAFYDGAAKTGHDVGVYLKEQQATSLQHLWEGINAGHMPPALTPTWFFKTFTDVPVDTSAGADVVAKAVAKHADFDGIWQQVTKFNLYDPLALLAAAPGASDLLFKGGDVAGTASKVRVIGAAEVADSGLIKDLMSGLAVVSLASATPKGAAALGEQLKLGDPKPGNLDAAMARYVARFGAPREPGIELVAFDKGAVYRERGGLTWRPVPNEVVDGGAYRPVQYTSKAVKDEAAKILRGEKTWAHKELLSKQELGALVGKMRSHMGPIKTDPSGLPLNPMGRTGVAGRGESNLGPILAQDLLLKTTDPASGKAFAVLIKRKDTGRWAMPGGIEDDKDKGAKIPTAVREFFEETAATHKDASVDVQGELLKAFKGATEVYKGGCPKEPRNTDNMWFETTVFSVEVPWKLASGLKLDGSDDASTAALVELTPTVIQSLHGDHPDFVKLALDKRGE